MEVSVGTSSWSSFGEDFRLRLALKDNLGLGLQYSKWGMAGVGQHDCVTLNLETLYMTLTFWKTLDREDSTK